MARSGAVDRHGCRVWQQCYAQLSFRETQRAIAVYRIGLRQTLLRYAAAGLALGLGHPAGADSVHEFSASSTARIAIRADGNVAMLVRNSRLVPYILYDGERHARLATITTDVRSRTDAEGVDPHSTVSFTVDDLSGAIPKRLEIVPRARRRGRGAGRTIRDRDDARMLRRRRPPPGARAGDRARPVPCDGRWRGRQFCLGRGAECKAANRPLGRL